MWKMRRKRSWDGVNTSHAYVGYLFVGVEYRTFVPPLDNLAGILYWEEIEM